MNNREIIIANIEESIEQLQEIVKEMSNNPEYSEVEFQIDIEHAYHHMNFSWNIRNEQFKDVTLCSDKNYKQWSKYPAYEMFDYE